MKMGYVKLWRKSKNSAVFAHEGLWKLFCLCLINANHKGGEVILDGVLKPIKVKSGQFITGRYSLHKDYHQAHLKKNYSRKAAPTAYTLIRWLQTLQYMQILSIKTCNKYSIITILNWNLYQPNEHQVSIKRASSEHKQEGFKNDKEAPDLFLLKKRYSDQVLIEKVFQAIALTRKTGKVVNSVLLAQLQKWERYPVDQVEAAIKVYLEKGCAGQGKDEKYLLGIIRNQKSDHPKDNPPPQPKEITDDNKGMLYEN